MTKMGAGQSRIKSLIAPPGGVMDRKRRDTTGQSQGTDSILVFPMDLSTHYMAFQFYRYEFDQTSFKRRHLDKTILLPVPLQLVEAINVNYNEAALGAVGGAISDLAARGNKNEIGSAADNVIKGASDLLGAVQDVAGGSSISEMLTNQNNNLGILSMGFRGGDGVTAAGLNRFFGSAPNPHITALFQGVGLRTHQFQWKLAPASKDESDKLGQIINTMRAAMLPARGKGNLTLKYPDECDIYIMGTGVDYMYHFKTAVIKTMNTNFAPDGVLSFFGETGAPTAVTLDLQLTETVIHTREDYENDKADKDPVDRVNFVGAVQEESAFIEMGNKALTFMDERKRQERIAAAKAAKLEIRVGY